MQGPNDRVVVFIPFRIGSAHDSRADRVLHRVIACGGHAPRVFGWHKQQSRAAQRLRAEKAGQAFNAVCSGRENPERDYRPLTGGSKEIIDGEP
jgi:hypothetical protein